MSTVCPTILKLTCLASASSESARALFARSRSSCLWRGDLAPWPAVSAFAAAPFFTSVSAIATLLGALVFSRIEQRHSGGLTDEHQYQQRAGTGDGANGAEHVLVGDLVGEAGEPSA